MTESFSERLAGVFAGPGRLCVGIDPHGWLLSTWGLPDTADGAREFGLRVAPSRIHEPMKNSSFFDDEI